MKHKNRLYRELLVNQRCANVSNWRLGQIANRRPGEKISMVELIEINAEWLHV